MHGTDDFETDDIAEVFSAESDRGRGKFRPSRKEAREQRQLRLDILKALQHKDERKFSAALRRADLRDGDERWANAWKIYRAYWADRP